VMYAARLELHLSQLTAGYEKKLLRTSNASRHSVGSVGLDSR